MTQAIRISQFVTTYGPGALLEGPDGPRVMPSPDNGLFASEGRYDPSDYEILEQRVSDGLLKNVRVFRLPSNAELRVPASRYIYRTLAFPTWKLCLNSAAHRGDFYVLYRGVGCPRCHNASKKGTEAIRFVVACAGGHMDEFDWHYFVHRGSQCTETGWFKWLGGGGALASITVECDSCGKKSVNLGKGWGTDWRCSGRSPEREPANSKPLRLGCIMKAKLIQRQASNLRVPELRTLFSIPPRYTQLHNLLQLGPIKDNILGQEPSSKQELERILRNLVKAKRVTVKAVESILEHPWQEIRDAIGTLSAEIPSSYRELILEEFEALKDASINGVPPVKGPPPTSTIVFHVNPNLAENCTLAGRYRLRVTPVLTLRTVMVQVGFRREVGSGQRPIVVPVSFNDRTNPEKEWYPGAEFLGEGIFISFENKDLGPQVSGGSSTGWSMVHKSSSAYPDEVFRDEHSHDELHPAFVWWHTLGHLLIRSIAAESGYSSSALRERVYLRLDGDKATGGVLLYATQPGSEGTLGGLISMVPHFQELIDLGVEQLRTCSGDPLCSDHVFGEGRYNGAACYSCLLLSETSCEHRNMWLDRNVMRESIA